MKDLDLILISVFWRLYRIRPPNNNHQKFPYILEENWGVLPAEGKGVNSMEKSVSEDDPIKMEADKLNAESNANANPSPNAKSMDEHWAG